MIHWGVIQIELPKRTFNLGGVEHEVHPWRGRQNSYGTEEFQGGHLMIYVV